MCISFINVQTVYKLVAKNSCKVASYRNIANPKINDWLRGSILDNSQLLIYAETVIRIAEAVWTFHPFHYFLIYKYGYW